FGSFAAFQARCAASATGVQGSGWAVLGWDCVGQRMLICQLFDQEANVAVGIAPLLLLDVWEHAFYLDYLNVEAEYVKAFWNLASWQDVAARLERARPQTAGLLA
ncbi:Fe-Mn family superoxide dismutase, partial [Isoptericola haloaureus]